MESSIENEMVGTRPKLWLNLLKLECVREREGEVRKRGEDC